MNWDFYYFMLKVIQYTGWFKTTLESKLVVFC